MRARSIALVLALWLPLGAAGADPSRARADERTAAGRDGMHGPLPSPAKTPRGATRSTTATTASASATANATATASATAGDDDHHDHAESDRDAADPTPRGAPPATHPDPLAGIEPRRRPDAVAEFAVIVSIDGLRADAVTPALRTLAMLQRTGAVATHAQTIERSTTLASHAAMVSGVDADVHGLTWNAWRPWRGHIRFPTLFRLARLAGIDGAMFVAKAKLRHLVDPDDGAATFRVAGGSCHRVVEAAEPWLRERRSGVALVHFPDPDSAGHRHGWMSPPYRRAVAQADACLGRVVAALRARRGGTERVLLVVTADHGGHGRSHGTRLDVDRDVPWIAWGGAAQRGARISRPMLTTDTAPTVLEALGLPATPGMSGRPVVEALRASRVRPHTRAPATDLAVRGSGATLRDTTASRGSTAWTAAAGSGPASSSTLGGVESLPSARRAPARSGMPGAH
jgi:hypothetical protein